MPVHTLRYDTQPGQLADVYAAVNARRQKTGNRVSAVDQEPEA